MGPQARGPGSPSNALRGPGPGAPLRAGYVETFFSEKSIFDSFWLENHQN